MKVLFKTLKFYISDIPGGGGGGWGVLPYISHIGMCCPVGWGFCAVFGLKTGLIHFAHFGLESGVVFEGTTGEYERINRFSSK